MARKRTLKEILESRKNKVRHEDEFLLGKIVGSHGIKGRLKVRSETQIFERQLEKLKELTVYRGLSKRTFKLKGFEPYKGGTYLLELEGVTDRNSADELVGGEIWVKDSETVELEPDEFFYDELIGCQVLLENGDVVGEVREILQQPASDVLVVDTKDGEVLIPFISEFVKNVDVKGRKITITPIDGLI